MSRLNLVARVAIAEFVTEKMQPTVQHAQPVSQMIYQSWQWF